MDFQVPQFIEIEDKIFGPLTFKQFVYIAGGAGIAFVVYSILSKFLPTIISIVLAVPLVGLGLALAFYKINERPLIFLVQAAVLYLFRGKLYQWKKEERALGEDRVTLPSAQKNPLAVSPARGERLTDIAWNLDVQNNQIKKGNNE